MILQINNRLKQLLILLLAVALVTTGSSQAGESDFTKGKEIREIDFPQGMIGGHAPTAVQWIAPGSGTYDIQCAVWKLRNNAFAEVSLWLNERALLESASIPPQAPSCNSAAPVTLNQLLMEKGYAEDRFTSIRMDQGDRILLDLGGNDYVGITLRITKDDKAWDLSEDFSENENPNGPWTYGQIKREPAGTMNLVPYDKVTDDFNPDGRGLFGPGQKAWIGSNLPPHFSLMKSTGHSPLKYEVRFTSGDTIFVEALINGHWVNRYWNSDGHINVLYERYAEECFEIAVNKTTCHDGWRVNSIDVEEISTDGSKHVVVDLSNEKYSLDVRIHTLLDGTGISTRWFDIHNCSDQPVALTDIYSWIGLLVAGSTFWGDPDPPQRFDHPFTLGYYTKSTHCWEGWFDWKPVNEGITQLGCELGQCYDDPFFLIRNNSTGQYLIGSLAWSANWKMVIDYKREGAYRLKVRIGPQATDALRIVDPGETIQTPSLHLGLLTGSLDDVVQAMHEHVRKSVLPERPADRSYLIQYAVPGDQGYLSERFGDPAGYTEESVKKNVDLAAEIGAELFIMDAGWWENQGNWYASKSRFPNGLDPIIDYIHDKGLLFGLYGEIEKAGPGSRVAKEHPEWLEWHKPYPVLNLSRPEVSDYMAKELSSLIERYRLDLYRLDFNTPWDTTFEGVSNNQGGLMENNFMRYYEQFYKIFNEIHEKYPDLILQQAACGGGRNDLGVVARFHEEYLTDGLRPPYVVQNYSGQTLMLPPENLIIAYGADGGGGTGHPDHFLTYLRITYTLSNPWIFFGMTAPDLDNFDQKRKVGFQRYSQLYKEFFRPRWNRCKVFHHAPVTAKGGVDSSCWFAQEFATPEKDSGWATIIKIKDSPELTYTFIPRGIDPSRRYHVTLDNLQTSFDIDGLQWMQQGIPLRLENISSSELIMYEQN